jgi:hypothetical protein
VAENLLNEEYSTTERDGNYVGSKSFVTKQDVRTWHVGMNNWSRCGEQIMK